MTSKPGPMLAEEQGMRMLKEEEVILAVSRTSFCSLGMDRCEVYMTFVRYESDILGWRG